VLTQEENDLLTQTGPGTPCGELMRRYWQPAALSEELPVGGAPVPIRLLGEDLVLFRDDDGQPGLLGIHCSHRGADLSYGRVEDGGLRCIYHGWLYDRNGRCLEQPGEPAGSTFHERIRQTAYPCIEKNGLIFAYLGPGEPPLLPGYRFLQVPANQVYPVKLLSQCNYLQGNEGNIDLLHVGFLHYSYRDLADAQQNASRVRRNGSDVDELDSRGSAPGLERCEAELTPEGLRVAKIRDLSPEENYIRIGTFMLPNLSATPGGQTNWHVPIDDTHHWKYTIVFSDSGPIDYEQVSRRHTMDEHYVPLANRSNRYLQDRSIMNTRSYSGIDPSFFQQQDLCATEGAGAIQDRTQEHLVVSDGPTVAGRKILLHAIKEVQEGRDPQHVIRDPARNDCKDVVTTFGTIPKGLSWKEHCHNLVQQGRGWQTRTQVAATAAR